MADAYYNMEHLKKFIKCSICLEKFDNPKQLNCYHHFCKKCLEGVMEFKEDGSAIVICPMRCSSETIIGANKTVNNMPASYELKGMLEVFKTEDKQSASEVPKCSYADCTKHVSVYCCEVMMCISCYVNHSKTSVGHGDKENVNLSFNKKENKLQVLCDEHVSDCTHLCVDNKFLCLYCLNRNKDHKNHTKNSITNDVEILREKLINDLSKQENIHRFLKITKEQQLLNKKKFEDLLQLRKKECLLRYNDFLNKQEELLKCQFESIFDIHMKQYPDVLPEYYQEKLRKHDIELALQKEEILDMIRTCENTSSITREIVSLSECFNFLSELPLGDLQVTFGENVLITDPPVATIEMKDNSFGTTTSERNNNEYDEKHDNHNEKHLSEQSDAVHQVEILACDMNSISFTTDTPVPLRASNIYESKNAGRFYRGASGRWERRTSEDGFLYQPILSLDELSSGNIVYEYDTRQQGGGHADIEDEKNKSNDLKKKKKKKKHERAPRFFK